jgi:hypothetical protein
MELQTCHKHQDDGGNDDGGDDDYDNDNELDPVDDPDVSVDGYISSLDEEEGEEVEEEEVINLAT